LNWTVSFIRLESKEQKISFKNDMKLGAVAHACNSRYLGGCDQEDHGSRPALANSSKDPISTNSQA
jgi:hypothetical protein